MKTTLLPLLALLALAQCTKKKDPDPADQLPPATQTGAGTFGCLVNGQPWTPKGNNGSSNYTVSYDRIASGGVLSIYTYRFYGQQANEFQTISLYSAYIQGIGVNYFQNQQRTRATFNDEKTNCYWSSRDSTTTYRRGALNITRLDLREGIISGTFWFTLYQPGCDSIRVTNGRFDRKL